MDDPTTCPHGEARASTSGGHCPACLIELGLDPAAEAPPGTSPLSADEAPTVTLKPSIVPGRLVGDRYRIEARLGSGAMGEVWRASDVKLRVEVALKALPPGLVRWENARWENARNSSFVIPYKSQRHHRGGQRRGRLLDRDAADAERPTSPPPRMP